MTPAEKQARYRANHPDIVDWKSTHPERAKEIGKKYRSSPKGKASITRNLVKYHKTEKAKIARHRRYEKHKEIFLARTRAYAKNNPEKVRLWKRVREQRRRCLKKSAKGTFTLEQWIGRMLVNRNRCVYCSVGLTEKTAQIDHAIPVSRKGTNWPANLVPACRSCNIRKNSKTFQEFRGI